jgi:hypothetical protein
VGLIGGVIVFCGGSIFNELIFGNSRRSSAMVSSRDQFMTP